MVNMVFKSDKQRKAVMAKLTGGTRSNVNPKIVNNPNRNDNIRISLRELKRLRDKAVKENKDRFFINGKPVLVSFARFWIPFIQSEIKRKGIRENERITVSPTK